MTRLIPALLIFISVGQDKPQTVVVRDTVRVAVRDTITLRDSVTVRDTVQVVKRITNTVTVRDTIVRRVTVVDTPFGYRLYRDFYRLLFWERLR